MKLRTTHRRGYSLIELLVTASILAFLAGIALPAVQKVQVVDAQVRCQKNLSEIGKAILAHETMHKTLPPRRSNGRGLGIELLPFLGQEELYKQFDLTQPFWAKDNHAVATKPLEVFRCPATPKQNFTKGILTAKDNSGPNAAISDYLAPHVMTDARLPNGKILGDYFGLRDGTGLTSSDIHDGISNTVMLSEQAGRPEFWILGVKQETLKANPTAVYANWFGPWAGFTTTWLMTFEKDGITPQGNCTINCNNGAGLYSFHEAKVQALFNDGSVRPLGKKLDPVVLFALFTRSGGEVIGPDDF